MRVLHVLDASADWEQRLAVGQLLDRLSRADGAHYLVSIDPRVPPADWFPGASIMRAPMRFDWPITAAPTLRRIFDEHCIDIFHAWGIDAALASVSAGAGRVAMVIQRFDPALTDRRAKSLRLMTESLSCAIACSTGTVRRRLIERGVPADRCVVIRPGVDFGRINTARRDGSIRRSLGLSDDCRLAVAYHPLTRSSGHDRIVWGCHLARYRDPKSKLAVYGRSAEADRLRRLSEPLPPPDSVLWLNPNRAAPVRKRSSDRAAPVRKRLTSPPRNQGNVHETPTGTRSAHCDSLHYEDLIAVADCLIITPFDDAPTTSIAWAMAASVPVIGSAVYGVAEYIVHKQNGLLIKPQRGPGMAIRIARHVAMIDQLAKQRETARGQAYEAFGVRRFADQHERLYQNLTSNAPPADGITDSAVDG